MAAQKSDPERQQTAVAAWQARMSYSDAQAAAALGMTKAGYQRNKLGRDQHGRPRAASHTLLLACAAIEHGVGPIGIAQDAPCAPSR